MGKIFGVVAEFNPFHNGHQALAAKTKEAGYSYCVAVMSGNYVQRGEPAIAEKRVRAKAALTQGVDLVLELPVQYAISSAQRFALGAVHLLKSTGCVDAISFGSECGEIAVLQELAAALDSPSFALGKYLAQGLSYPKANALALKELAGEQAYQHFLLANNLLGIQYLRAAKTLGWQPGAFTTKRVGTAHDAAKAAGRFASASLLRSHADDSTHAKAYMPKESYRVLEQARQDGLYPFHKGAFEAMAYSYLRRLPLSRLSSLPGISEGIDQRLHHAIRAAGSWEGIMWQAKTKRYPLSRIRRLMLSAFLDLDAADAGILPPYLRVLGFNKRGKEVLAKMKTTACLPVGTSLAELGKMGKDCALFAGREALSTDLYTAALPVVKPCGSDYTEAGVYL